MTNTEFDSEIARLREAIENADAIVVGAGAGLSTAAGLTYSGERFERLFPDFIERYGIRDMYSGVERHFDAPGFSDFRSTYLM